MIHRCAGDAESLVAPPVKQWTTGHRQWVAQLQAASADRLDGYCGFSLLKQGWYCLLCLSGMQNESMLWRDFRQTWTTRRRQWEARTVGGKEYLSNGYFGTVEIKCGFCLSMHMRHALSMVLVKYLCEQIVEEVWFHIGFVYMRSNIISMPKCRCYTKR